MYPYKPSPPGKRPSVPVKTINLSSTELAASDSVALKMAALNNNVAGILDKQPASAQNPGDKMTVSRIRFEVDRARKFIDKLEKNVNILEQEKAASPQRLRNGSPKKSFIEQKIDQDAMDPGYGAGGAEWPSQEETVS